MDGERWQLPWTLPGGQVWATLEGRHVVVHAICGLRLLYDWGSQVYLSVPSAFHGRLAGLCGAFGDDKDPLNLPLDTRSSPTGPVAAPCPLPAVDLGFSMNCSMQLTPLFKAPKICGLLQAPDGPFGHCLGQVDPKPFLRICLQDECHSQDGNQSLCQALTAYTAACQEAGIPVLPWRSPDLCREFLAWVWVWICIEADQHPLSWRESRSPDRWNRPRRSRGQTVTGRVTVIAKVDDGKFARAEGQLLSGGSKRGKESDMPLLSVCPQPCLARPDTTIASVPRRVQEAVSCLPAPLTVPPSAMRAVSVSPALSLMALIVCPVTTAAACTMDVTYR